MNRLGNSEDNSDDCIDLLDILREKHKIRIGHSQSDDYIILKRSTREDENLHLSSMSNELSEPLESTANIESDAEINSDSKQFKNISALPKSQHNYPDNDADISTEGTPNKSICPDNNNSSIIEQESQTTINSTQQKKLTPKEVFISYSYDSYEHKKLVYELSEELRKKGNKCTIDSHVTHNLLKDWDIWMSEQIEKSDFVLVVCTKKYEEKFKERKGGAGWEGAIIRREIYEYYNANKFIQILFCKEDRKYLLNSLGGNTYCLDVKDRKKYESEFTRLQRQLIGHPSVWISPVGPLWVPDYDYY